MDLPLWNKYGPKECLNMTEIQSLGVSEIQKIEVSDAIDWVWSVSDKDIIYAEDIPSIAPPFQAMWLESRYPKWVKIGNRVRPFADLRPDCAASNEGAYSLFIYVKDEDGWILLQSVKLRMQHQFWVSASRAIRLDENGRIIIEEYPMSVMVDPRLAKPPYNWTGEILKEEGEKLYVWLDSFCFAVAFMHCKNVELVAANPPPLKLAKKRARLGRPPFVEHKVLTIGKMREVLRAAGSQTDIKMAMHLCRGHFKTYTPDAPLFGKHIGTYWHDAHVRGSEDVGKISKTYRVSP